MPKPIPNSRTELLFNYWCERKVFKQRRLSFAECSRSSRTLTRCQGLSCPVMSRSQKTLAQRIDGT